MHPKSAASLPPWLARAARPWMVATICGLLLGVALIRVESLVSDDTGYIEATHPRAAVAEPPSISLTPRDPFSPTGTLSAPPELPATSPDATHAAPPPPAAEPAS